jgi:hypothetical protein
MTIEKIPDQSAADDAEHKVNADRARFENLAEYRFVRLMSGH